MLLAFIAPPGSHAEPLCSQDALATLAPDDWTQLLTMARQHRLLPLWHWQHRQRCALAMPHGLPEPVAQALAKAFEQGTRRALLLQRELLQVHGILSGLGIESVALKGAFLALYAYPHPALRPLRDLDILVPHPQAVQAHEALLAAGFTPASHAPQGSAGANLDLSQHLPGLRSPQGGINVELHTRLFHLHAHDPSLLASAHQGDPNDAPHDDALKDLADDPRFWERSAPRTLAGKALRFESPTDLLLHLIVHAVYDHEFNNGPLVLSDIAFLLQTQPVDGPLFWRMAAQRHQTRGCELLLRLTERHWGASAALTALLALLTEPPDRATVAGQQDMDEITRKDALTERLPLDLAAHAMLRDFDARRDVKFGADVAQHARWVDRFRVYASKVFRPRAVIAATYPVSATSPLVFLWYPVEWARLAFRRLPAFVWSQRHARARREMRQIGHLRAWLAREEPPRPS